MIISLFFHSSNWLIMLDFSPLFLNVEKHVQWSLSHVTESKIFQRQLLCELKTGLTCLYMFRVLLLQNKSFRQFRVRRNNMLMKNKAMLFFGQCVVDPVSNSREGKYHRTSTISVMFEYLMKIFFVSQRFLLDMLIFRCCGQFKET